MTYQHNLTREQIARHFNVSLTKVKVMMRKRQIPFLRVPPTPTGAPRFSAQECEEYFASNGGMKRKAA